MRLYASNFAMFSRVVDAATLGISLWGIVYIDGGHWGGHHSLATACAIGMFFFFSQLHDVYRSWRGSTIRYKVGGIWLSWFSVILGLLFLAFITKTSEEYSRRIILTWFAVAPLALTSRRL